MEKIDYKKQMKELFAPSASQPSRIRVPSLLYLMIGGEGDPETSPHFQDAIQALYALAYGLKMLAKKDPKLHDYVVPPLEGLWWAEDMSAFERSRRDEWKWTLMIMQPDFVSPAMFVKSVEQARAKKAIACIDEVRLERYEEGEAMQVLHVGPFSAEGPTVERLHQEIAASDCEPALKHHEI